MITVIFAGGTGTRLWPLSRKNSPKQFEKIFDGKSTIQLAVNRVAPKFGFENVYVSTNERYVSTIKNQLPKIPATNIIAEPEKRDVGPAIGYNLMKLRKMGHRGPVAILWADHLMERVNEFIWALKTGESLVRKNPQQIVFIAEKPRYPENNLGWINVGEKIKDKMYGFKGWHYRPPLEKCKKMFASKKWFWNPGYFVLDIDFTIDLYRKHVPTMYQGLEKITEAIGTIHEAKVLRKIYPTLEAIHFDNAIAEKVKPEQAVVLVPDMGWSDPGTLYALKEALQKSPKENVTRGKVYTFESKDCLVYNYEEKLLATVGLQGCIVVNMDDALLVVRKEDVPKVKKLVGELEKSGFGKYI